MPTVPLSNLTQFAAVNLMSDPGRIAGPKIIPNCCSVRLNWTMPNGKTGHQIAYAQWSGTPSLTPALADAIKAGFVNGTTWSNFASNLGSGFALAGVTLLDLRSATASEVNSTSAAVPGTGTAPFLPEEVAAVITLKTANRGPSGRGRIYMLGLTAANVTTGGVMLAGTVGNLTAWATSNLKATIDSQLGPLSLALPARAAYVSPLTGRSFPARAATTVVVTQALCRNNTFDSQRKRGLK